MSKKRNKQSKEKSIPDGKVSTTELIRAISGSTGVTQVDTAKVVKALIAQIQLEVFENGNQVVLVNFGKFWRKQVKAKNDKIINLTKSKSNKKKKPKYALTFRTSANIRHELAERVKKNTDSLI